MATNLLQYGDFQLLADFPNLVTNGDFTDWTDGPELVTDTGFDDSAEWTAGGTWVVDDSGDSLATVTGDGSSQTLFQAHAAVELGQNFEITYEVTVNTLTGTPSAAFAGIFSNSVLDISVGVHTVNMGSFDPSQLSEGFEFVLGSGVSGGTLSITSLSVKQIGPDDWYAYQGTVSRALLSEVGSDELAGGVGTGALNIEGVNPATRDMALRNKQLNSVTDLDQNTLYDITLDQNLNEAESGLQYILLDDNGPLHKVSGVPVAIQVDSGTSGSPFTIGNAEVADSDITIDNVFVRKSSPWAFDQDWDLRTDSLATWTSSADDNQEGLNQFNMNVTEGRYYKLTITVANLSFADSLSVIRLNLNRGADPSEHRAINTNGTHVLYLIAGPTPAQGFRIVPLLDTAGDTFDISDLLLEATVPGTDSDTLIITGDLRICDPAKVGPAGVYVRTETVNDGRFVWQSQINHPHCLDGDLVPWYLWYNDSETRWEMGEEIGVHNPGDWFGGASTAETPTDQTLDPQDTSTGDAIIFNEPLTEFFNGYRSRYGIAARYKSRYQTANRYRR